MARDEERALTRNETIRLRMIPLESSMRARTSAQKLAFLHEC